MSKKKPARVQARIVKAREKPVKKADISTQLSVDDQFNASEWVSQPIDLAALEKMVNESSILPQCIRAYKNNIPGFGIGLKYAEDVDETAEMKDEMHKASEIIELLNTDQDTNDVFADIIEARETFGIAYLEVIRNLEGDVQQIEFINDTPSIHMTIPMDPYQEVTYYHHGTETVRRKKFRKYAQTIGGKTVYYKEFGDPRIMDYRDGNYVNELEPQFRANEILPFRLGTKPYGQIRWIGQILGVDGSRRAEALNNNYFINGRHTPMMIVVKGGTLTDDSFAKLQEYMDDIKGENGQHAFLVLEAENAEDQTAFENQNKPEIEIKDLASILQKDELFQEYLDNNRRRVQSAFQLPDLYVGYTTDFNRATAQTAQEVTEQQVFQPERKSLAWIINHKLLNGYQFKYVEAYFKTPDLSNPDDIYKMLSVANAAGGVTPNDARSILFKQLGEKSEDFEEDWANIPLAVSKNEETLDAAMSNILSQLGGQIEKAQGNQENDEIVSVMKSVRNVLSDLQKDNSTKKADGASDGSEQD